MLPFAISWTLVDLFLISASIGVVGGPIIIFFIIHMFPVWIYLAGLFTIALKYKREAYILTDRAVYYSHGVVSVECDTKLFADMSHVDVHRGVFDQMLKVGAVVMTASNGTIRIIDIPDYEEVFKLAKKLQEDVYADVQFPTRTARPRTPVTTQPTYLLRSRKSASESVPICISSGEPAAMTIHAVTETVDQFHIWLIY